MKKVYNEKMEKSKKVITSKNCLDSINSFIKVYWFFASLSEWLERRLTESSLSSTLLQYCDILLVIQAGVCVAFDSDQLKNTKKTIGRQNLSF